MRVVRFLTSVGSTVAEHSTTDREIKGFDPARPRSATVENSEQKISIYSIFIPRLQFHELDRKYFRIK
jgi:hypothetical protein